jgi:mRNA interferase MazF
MAKGDIVLITFPFTDLSGNKYRPTVILAESIQDVTVCFITTQIEWQELTDIVLKPSNTNGLRRLSLIRIGKIATLDKKLIKGIMGRLTSSEIIDLNMQLKIVFQLE